MATTERLRLSDLVATRIRQHIVENDLQVGDRLPTEHEFADRLGVSRLAVREATRALGFLGLVDAAPRRGLTVGRLDFDQVAPFLQYHPSVQQASPDQLIDTRIIIEIGGLPLALPRIQADPNLAKSLLAAAAAFHHARDLATWVRLDIEFHRQLLAASGLTPLMAFNDLLQLFFQRFRESIEQAEWQDGLESHHQIVRALIAGNLNEACTALRQHIESHRTRMRSGT